MFEKAEDEYNDLISKKNIIEVGTNFETNSFSVILSLCKLVGLLANFSCHVRMTSQKSRK